MSTLGADLAAAFDPVAFARRLRFDAEPWEARLLRSTARRQLVACSRQVGKTTTVAYKAVHTAVYPKGSGLVLIVSPTQRQSDEMLRRVRGVYRAAGRPVATVADSSSMLELENGSRIVSLPGTEGTTRSFAGAELLVIDEAARVEDDVFAGVLPMVASTGTLACLSTPWGQRGFFYDLWADDTNGWERHRVTVYDSAQWPPGRIAEVRRSVGSFVFASDYEALFTDTEQQIFTTSAVRAAFTPGIAPLFAGGTT